MKTVKPLAKWKMKKLWKAVVDSVDHPEFDDLARNAPFGPTMPEPTWAELAYVARCVIAVRGMARKAKQPK